MLGLLLNFSIPPNAFGPGLSIAHYGTIVVNSNARIGANCRIHVCVNIGADARDGTKAPHIGDNCYIGPGAKIFGAIKIGNHVAIGANAVVNKSFVENNVSLGGIPAKVISETGTGEIESMQAVSEASKGALPVRPFLLAAVISPDDYLSSRMVSISNQPPSGRTPPIICREYTVARLNASPF
jgi:serine acetyltransferase